MSSYFSACPKSAIIALLSLPTILYHSVAHRVSTGPPLIASNPEQQFCRSHQALRSLKLAQSLSHLPEQVLLLRLSELPQYPSSQPASCRVQERIERRVMGLKGKHTGDDLRKARF